MQKQKVVNGLNICKVKQTVVNEQYTVLKYIIVYHTIVFKCTLSFMLFLIALQ